MNTHETKEAKMEQNFMSSIVRLFSSKDKKKKRKKKAPYNFI